MAGSTPAPKISLPRGWPRPVRSAVIHTGSADGVFGMDTPLQDTDLLLTIAVAV